MLALLSLVLFAQPDVCDVMFGSAEVREANAKERQRRFKLVHDSGDVVDIVYEGLPLREPLVVHVPGVHIDETRALDERGRARVALLTAAHCDGPRELHVDDAWGGAAVVAVVERGVLVESGGALYFVPVDDRAAPMFRLVWRSSFTLSYPRPAPSTPPPPRRR